MHTYQYKYNAFTCIPPLEGVVGLLLLHSLLTGGYTPKLEMACGLLYPLYTFQRFPNIMLDRNTQQLQIMNHDL